MLKRVFTVVFGHWHTESNQVEKKRIVLISPNGGLPLCVLLVLSGVPGGGLFIRRAKGQSPFIRSLRLFASLTVILPLTDVISPASLKREKARMQVSTAVPAIAAICLRVKGMVFPYLSIISTRT
jgi:hypothetical protein